MKKLLTLILALTMLLSAVCFAENITADVATVTPAAEGENLKVCWIPICTGIDYFSPIAQGIEALCTELGMEYSTVAPDVANATSQIPYIETQIQNGVDILLIAPNSTDALNATLQNAIDAGVVVLMVNDDITGNTNYRHGCVIGTNYDELAAVMFEKLVADMGDQGQWCIISSTTDAPVTIYLPHVRGSQPQARDISLPKLYNGWAMV